MLVTFNCTLMYDRFGGDDWDIDVNITEEEYERLKKAHNTDVEFRDCDSVKDIYKRIYDIANDDATENLLEYDEYFQEEHEENEDLKADDLYSIGVNYPYQV